MPPPPPYAGQPQGQQGQPSTPFPALYLYPLNDSFVPKHISLVAGQRVKIGRQTNPKTAPGEKNGFFDSKVLSRQHAEIWEDGSKIYIKDVKSSNGTFINGERLSPEGVESEPYELKSDDIVEFGIDIVGEDNKTIIHHKVAARAVCVFSDQDAQIAARAEQHQQQQQQQQHLLAQQQHPHHPHAQHPHQQQQYGQQSLMGAGQPGPNSLPGSQFNFVGGQRRPGAPNVAAAQGGIAGIGGMGGSMRPPGKSGLTFEHILSRLQGELQKSRETGSELHSLTGSMSDIHDVLGGNMPSNVPPYPSSLPPVRPTRQSSPSQNHPPQEPQPQPSDQSPSVITQLQSQLHETQSSLAEHATKVRALEDVLADQDLIRKEVHDLRQLFEARRQEIVFDDPIEHEQRRPEDDEEGLLEPRGGFDPDDDDDIQHIRMLDEVDEVDDEDDEDDRRSIATIIPHELERVDEVDEEGLEETHEGVIDEVEAYGEDRADPIDPQREREGTEHQERERERQFEREAIRKQEDLNVGRPRTPEPSFGLRPEDSTKPGTINTSPIATSSPRTRSGTLVAPKSPLSLQPINGVTNDQMLEQVLQLSAQISAMVKITSSMESQYAAAQDTIRTLESKVGELERAAKEKQEEGVKKEESEEQVKSTIQDLVAKEWKKSFEGQWSEVREEWKEERERLRRAREEWENRILNLDTSLDKMNQLHTTTNSLVKDLGTQKGEMLRMQNQLREVQLAGLRVGGLGANGDVLGHGHGRGSGLVTPPSPRSQSSDSGGGGRRRRRKRRSASVSGRGRAAVKGESEEDLSEEEAGGGVDAVKVTEGAATTTTVKTRAYHLSHHNLYDEAHYQDLDVHLHIEDDTASASSQFASEEEVEEGRKVPGPVKTHKSPGEGSGRGEQTQTHLPTPKSLTASIVSENEGEAPQKPLTTTKPPAQAMATTGVSFQTAGAVVVLAVAAAAVFWKVRSE